MLLPTEKTEATAVDPRILVLYGAPKVGKTTLLSKLPNCLIVDVEDGTDYVDALRVKVHNVAELRDLIASLAAAKGGPYRYVALDTISTLEEWCEGLATENYKKSATGKNFTGESVLELANGAGYLWLRLAVQDLIRALGAVSRNFIIMGHLRDKELIKAGKEVAAKDIDLTGKVRNIICSRADAVGYLYRPTNMEAQVSFMASDEVNCGSRCEHIRGKNFEFDWKKIYSTDPAL